MNVAAQIATAGPQAVPPALPGTAPVTPAVGSDDFAAAMLAQTPDSPLTPAGTSTVATPGVPLAGAVSVLVSTAPVRSVAGSVGPPHVPSSKSQADLMAATPNSSQPPSTLPDTTTLVKAAPGASTPAPVVAPAAPQEAAPTAPATPLDGSVEGLAPTPLMDAATTKAAAEPTLTSRPAKAEPTRQGRASDGAQGKAGATTNPPVSSAITVAAAAQTPTAVPDATSVAPPATTAAQPADAVPTQAEPAKRGPAIQLAAPAVANSDGTPGQAVAPATPAAREVIQPASDLSPVSGTGHARGSSTHASAVEQGEPDADATWGSEVAQTVGSTAAWTHAAAPAAHADGASFHPSLASDVRPQIETGAVSSDPRSTTAVGSGPSAVAVPPQLYAAPARRLEVAVNDPVLGRLDVRAEMRGGALYASIAGGGGTVANAMPALHQFLQEHQVAVHSLDFPAASGGVASGNSPAVFAGSEYTGGTAAGANGQPSQPQSRDRQPSQPRSQYASQDSAMEAIRRPAAGVPVSSGGVSSTGSVSIHI